MAVAEPPSPRGDVLVHPDHAPLTTSPSQTTVSTITNDLARSKISTNNSPGLSETKPPTNKSSDLSDVNTPIGQPSSEKECTNCGNFNAKSYCAGCHEAPNTDGTPHVGVRYCSRGCQKTNWPAHRLECKNLQARKALFKAAGLLQKIWYTVRREAFDNCIVKTEEVNGELLIHEGDYDLEPTKRKDGFYRKFPDAIFKNQQDADACLNLLSCTDSLSHMYMVNHWLLKCICADVKEVKVRVKKPVRRCRYTRTEWDRDFLHEVLQARLHPGEIYAIDLTGAQYGWYEPITEWDTYSLRCTEYLRTTLYGTTDEKLPLGSVARSMLVGTFSDPWDGRTEAQRAIPMFGECLKREFNKVFVQEVVSKHPRGLDVLKLSSEEFELAEKHIISTTMRITDYAAEKVDALQSIIMIETRMCNERMRQEFMIDAGTILTDGLTQLAGIFNGEWLRNGLTGRLIPLAMMRCRQDQDYLNRYAGGELAEQKLWGDLTLDHSVDVFRLKKDLAL